MNHTEDNKRIAKNTLYLYLRMGIGMLVSLYTSRIVLQQLGVVDYGIYGVVGGMVVLFSALQSSMGGATQRFITIEIGKENNKSANTTFNTSVHIHALIVLLFVLIIEPIGLWFLKNEMQIPVDRLFAAGIVFQCAVASTVIVFMNIPFMAVVVAYERMNAFAYISIIEIFLKLGVAFLLQLDLKDKLILYAILMSLIPFVSNIFYYWYCRRFEITKFRKIFIKSTFKEMLAFAGWTLWGNVSAVLASQGLNVLLNVFFGPAVNAARTIAVQVQTVIMQFSTNFQTAVNPQITKDYATGDLERMNLLILRSSKITLYLLLVLAIPIMVEIADILKLWLGEFPDYTVSFAIIIIVTSIVDAISRPIITAVSASGKIRKYQVVVGVILLMTLPVSYITLRLGGDPNSVFIANLIVIVTAMFVRLFMAKPIIGISVSGFLFDVIIRGIITSSIAFTSASLFRMLLDNSLISTAIVIITSFVITVFVSYFLGLNKTERTFINSYVMSIKKLITK